MPEFYKKVDHMVWVVNDLSSVMLEWKSLGFHQIYKLGNVTIDDGMLKQAAKAATADLGGTHVLWIQPLENAGILGEFRKSHGEGVYSLVHRAGEKNAIMTEIDRLKSENMGEYREVTIRGKAGEMHYFFMNTMDQGKYALGLIEATEQSFFNRKYDGENKLDMQFSQYAFAIKSAKSVSDFWASFGLPAMSMTHPDIFDKQYYGQTADFDMDLGWQRHGTIVYEWCIPKKGPNVYADFINTYGEGVQHLGFQVDDMDKTIEVMQSKGLRVSQSGGWGEKGKAGSGRFAYIDTEAYGGLTIELLWNYKE